VRVMGERREERMSGGFGEDGDGDGDVVNGK
jgi:hypothetical protein